MSSVDERYDHELERMIRAALPPDSVNRGFYIDELVAVVRRHTADLREAIARKDVLIAHLERQLKEGMVP